MSYELLEYGACATVMTFNVVMLTLWGLIEHPATVRRWAACHAGIAAAFLAYLIWATR